MPSVFVGTPSVAPEVCGHFKVSVPALAGAYIDGTDDDMVKIYSVGKPRSRLEQHERSTGTAQSAAAIVDLSTSLLFAAGGGESTTPRTDHGAAAEVDLPISLLSTPRVEHVQGHRGTRYGQHRDS